MNCGAFIDTAWADHGAEPQAVADRLATNLHLLQDAEHAAPYAQLVVHVFGEHLGAWQRGVELLTSLHAVPAAANDNAVSRSIAALRLAAGDASAADALPADERIAALALATAALAGQRQFAAAMAAYAQAVELAQAGLSAGSPALRALAVGGNNLAAALEERQGRSADEAAGMVSAAVSSLHFWRLFGGWLEEERAEYRLAKSLLASGDAALLAPACAAAQRCLDICDRHEAPPFERFLGHAVLAIARRAAGDETGFNAAAEGARFLHARLAAEERAWCADEWAALQIPATQFLD